MSLSTIIETMDTPMVDFNEDSDIPMGGSNENWFLPVSRMEEDGQMAQENYSHTESLEVDMVEYEEMAEYDMDEEAVEQGEQNLVDAEVLDVSFHSSPIPPVPQELGQIHPLDMTPIDAPAEIPQPQLEEHTGLAALTQEIVETAEPTVIASLPTSDGTIVHEVANSYHEEQQTHVGVDESTRLEEPLSGTIGTLQDNIAAEGDVGLTNDTRPDQMLSQVEGSESVPPVDYAVPSDGDYATKVVALTTNEDPSLEATPVEHAETDHDTISTVTVKRGQEAPDTDDNASIPPHPAEQAASNEEYHDESYVAESTEAGAQDYHELLGEEQSNSPPIHLKLNVRSSEGDQPDFALFRTPDVPHDGDQPPEEPLVLLQHHQVLFYEPISTVFDAFRHEEYFSHLEELSDAEMSISAPDLQLLVSEDNIYAREVSLHDLHAMHQGLGLPGHLRLTLQSVVPRFITRYNQLRDQITRLAIGDISHDGHSHGHQVTGHQDTNSSYEPSSLQNKTKELLANSGSPRADISNHDGLEGQSGESIVHATESTIEVAAEEPDGDQDDNEATLGQPEDTVEHAGVNDHDDAPYEDEFGEEDAEEKEEDYRDELDADRIHDGNEDAREEDREEEHATEFNDEVASEDDDEEGYEEFGENGNEGVGTVADNFDGTIIEDDSAESSSAEDEIDEADNTRHSEVQAQALSHSTSATSHSTEESNAVSEDSVVIVSDELVDHTGPGDPSEEMTELVNEGKIAEGNDEFGDEDFGEEDFNEDAATEDTLEESPDKNAEELDTASQVIFAESEKFASEHDTVVHTNDVFADIDADALLGPDENLLRTPVIKATATKVDEYVIVHKNSSKRSIDEADLEEEDLPSPSSSPGSKRVRVL